MNSITVFAKVPPRFIGKMADDPSKVGVLQDPHLKIDLLGEMVEACHKQGILVVSYISTMYDQRMWRMHGDWRVLNEDGSEAGCSSERPVRSYWGMGRVCINSGMLDYLAAQAEEVMKNY